MKIAFPDPKIEGKATSQNDKATIEKRLRKIYGVSTDEADKEREYLLSRLRK